MMTRSNFIVTLTICALTSITCLASVIEVESKNAFDKELKQGKPVVVKFYATWCPPCNQLKPIFEKLSHKTEYREVVFLAVDVDKHEDLTAKYDIRGMPTTLFFDAKGKEVQRISGGKNFIKEASQVINQKLLNKAIAPSCEKTVKKNEA